MGTNYSIDTPNILIRILANKNEYILVKSWIMSILANFGSEEAISAISQQLQSSDVELQKIAKDTLKQIRKSKKPRLLYWS